MKAVDIAILVVWIAFWVYWLAVAGSVKEGQSGWSRFAGIRVLILIIVISLIRSKAFGQTRSTSNDWRLGIGLAVFLSGLAVAVWARRYLGQNWGMPMTEKANPELVTTGPYSRVRHPIYTGIILAMIGTTIAVSLYWAVAVLALGGYFIFSAFMEERYMVTRFPDSYPEYRRSTKMLVPFVF